MVERHGDAFRLHSTRLALSARYRFLPGGGGVRPRHHGRLTARRARPNSPEMAKAGRFESPVGRLMAQLILVTPDYEGPTQEELLEESKDWLR